MATALSACPVARKHQLKIARATLKLSDAGARIMGGMTKDEARELLACSKTQSAG